MLRRCSDILSTLKEEGLKREFKVEVKSGRLILEKPDLNIVVECRDTTGPITERFIENWYNEVKEYKYKILITLGYYTKKALSYIFRKVKPKGTVLLLEAGLKDYMDSSMNFKYLPTNNSEVNNIVLEALDRLNIKPTQFTCSYCGNSAITSCGYCDALLCRRHFIICPVCGDWFCHPDTGKDCFHKHKCTPR